MHTFFVKYPIILPLLAFISGILFSEHLGYPWVFIVVITPIIGALYLLIPRLKYLLFVPLGILFSASPILPENHVIYHLGKKMDIVGTVYDSPRSRKEGSRLFIDVKEIIANGNKETVSGKVIVNSKETVRGIYTGDRVRILNPKLKRYRSFKNPGSFDVRRFYESQEIYASGFIPGMDWIVIFRDQEHIAPLSGFINRLRSSFGGFVRNNLPSPENEVLSAITIGEKGGIPFELRDEFSAAGIAHLLAISGLHVGAIALVFYFAIKWILKRSEYLLIKFQVPRLSAALTIIPIFLYTAIAGFSTPVVRAFIMITLYLLSILIGKEENKLNTLGVAALVILLWQPWVLFQLSFQLSFTAVLGIIFINRYYPLRFDTFRGKIISSVKITLAASFATLPFIINSFGVLSLISVPANLIFVPLVEFLIVPLGLLSILAFSVSETIALPLLLLNGFLIKIMILGAQMLLEIPFSSLTVPSISVFGWLFYGGTVLFVVVQKIYPRLRYALPIIVFGFIATLVSSNVSKANRGSLEVDFLDAANKSIAFVRLPYGKTVLIDGGYSYFKGKGFMERMVIAPFLLKTRTTIIDYFILTSLDKDHLEGVKYLLKKFKVKRLWTNGGKLDGELWEIIREKKITWKNILDEVEDFEIEGVQIGFMKPRGGFQIRDSARPYPLIMKFVFGQSSFLLGESLENTMVQRELVDVYSDKIKSKVVYIPRLDRLLRDEADFLNAVSPAILISSGHKKSLSNAHEREDTNLFETSHEGMVTIITDGNEIRVNSFVSGELSVIDTRDL